MNKFIEKLIGRLEEVAIETLGINKGQFAMDEGEYSSYCSLTLYDVKNRQTNLQRNIMTVGFLAVRDCRIKVANTL